MSDRTSFLADLKPGGSFFVEDLYIVGGIPAIVKNLLENDLLQGNCMTVTGHDIENSCQESQT